jgi:hypothetical protein
MANHFDFDQWNAQRQSKHTCTVFGKLYTNLPDLPFALGIELDNYLSGRGEWSLEEQQQLIKRIIDHVFGAQTFEQWQNDDRFTNELCGDLLTFIRAGYRPEIFTALIESAEKNAGVLAQTLIGANTGNVSTLTSGNSTESTLLDPTTLPGENSNPSSPDSLV